MKLKKWRWLAFMLLALCGISHADPVKRVLVYIDPQEYTHQIKLWHFYYSYWFSQGEAVEPIAVDALKTIFPDTSMCESTLAADMVIWIKPGMFYNPHMFTYYGRITARIYSGSGKPIATFREDVERQGFLDVMPAAQVGSTYKNAMQGIIRQMQEDNAMKAFVSQGVPESETKMPCSMVSILLPAR
jgi:hypothetical protein